MGGLRILMVTRGVVAIRPGCGGAELVAYQLARALSLQGHRVSLVSDVEANHYPGSPNLVMIPIRSRTQRIVTRLPGGFLRWLVQHFVGNVTAAIAMRRLLRAGHYDVVHAHGALTAVLISVLSNTPLVYTEHDAPPWHCRYRRWWERAIRTCVYRVVNVVAFARADAVAATFEGLRGELVERWGVPAERVITIPNGADLAVFSTQRRIGGPAERPFGSYCLFVGRLESRKAPDLLLRAVAESPGISCVVAGDGPLRQKLERLAEKLGIAARVRFLGNVPAARLAGIYADAELLVLPSVSEASPLVVSEAMACGTPVLATNIAGLPALVTEWETGFLVRPGDVGQLAVALRFLMHDGELRRRMSRNASAGLQQRFVWSSVACEYDRLYQRVVPDALTPADVTDATPLAHAA